MNLELRGEGGGDLSEGGAWVECGWNKGAG